MRLPKTFPELRTQRLTLRQLTNSDVKTLAALRSNESVNKFIARKAMQTESEASAFITKTNGNVSDDKCLYWAIALHENPALIGTACLWNFTADGQQAELGYELHPDHQRKGIMREAVQAVISLAFESFLFQQLVAYTHHENTASISLLKRNGFLLDPDKRDPGVPNNRVFTLPKSSWKSTLE